MIGGKAGRGVLGQGLSRVDGHDKVLGRTQYTGDVTLGGMAHAVLVQSTIASGRVTGWAMEPSPGVLGVLTPDNCPQMCELPEELTRDLPAERRPPLADWRVHYAGQHLVLVVAETLVQTEFAAGRMRFTYEETPGVMSAVEALHRREPGIEHGQVRAGVYFPDHFTKMEAEKLQYARGTRPTIAAARVDKTYTTPVEHHNPIETVATIAEWHGEQLTLHDTTRWLLGSRKTMAGYLNMPEEQVRILCPFLGGAFGAKGFLWQHSALVAVAAKMLGRPVKLHVPRAQMFTSHGHRPETVQQLRLAADGAGRLLSTQHDTLTETSPVAHFVEPTGISSKSLYRSPHCTMTHAVARIHRPTPLFMRAPGEAAGVYALECAMDELAYACDPPIDPLEFRIRNYAEVDQDGDKPFASKHLRECYDVAARRYGWEHRSMEPRSMRRGRLLVGQGMATATYPGRRMAASAEASIDIDGVLTVTVATHELGNGVRTVLTQVAAQSSGLPVEQIRVLTGDSAYAEAPYTGASQSTASTGPAVQAAIAELMRVVIQCAVEDRESSLFGVDAAAVRAEDGRMWFGGRSASVKEVVARHGREIHATREAKPPEDMEEASHQSFGAHFAEVEVDEEIGQVRVARWVGAYDAGAILNPKLAKSQVMGGVIFGIGMALMEETVYDRVSGLPVNASLGEYHVPTNADVPDFDLTLLEYPDYGLNRLGARGIGELGIVGAPAAIANAIFHATGRRHRNLPIRPEAVRAGSAG